MGPEHASLISSTFRTRPMAPTCRIDARVAEQRPASGRRVGVAPDEQGEGARGDLGWVLRCRGARSSRPPARVGWPRRGASRSRGDRSCGRRAPCSGPWRRSSYRPRARPRGPVRRCTRRRHRRRVDRVGLGVRRDATVRPTPSSIRPPDGGRTWRPRVGAVQLDGGLACPSPPGRSGRLSARSRDQFSGGPTMMRARPAGARARSNARDAVEPDVMAEHRVRVEPAGDDRVDGLGPSR